MVNIEIIFGDEDTPEYQAAIQLKQILETSFKSNEIGKIVIAPNVTCFGQDPKDIDIVVFGEFSGVARNTWTKVAQWSSQSKKPIIIDEKPSHKYVNFKNFCFCIEVKDHSPERIKIEGQHLAVSYKGKWSDASTQNERQKYSLKQFLTDKVNWSPYICNFIWLRNVNREHLPKSPENLLPSQPSLNELFNLACMQKTPLYQNGSIYFSCTNNSGETVLQDFTRVFSLFKHTEENLGRLTREKLELITKRALLRDQQYAQSIGKKLVIIQGRPGTGKTIKLLHIAHDLCKYQNQRVLILTYNKALVSDIQRMIALAKISSDISEPTINIRTVHSFIRILLLCLKIYQPKEKSSDNENLFLTQYDRLKAELLEYISSGTLTKDDLSKAMKERFEELEWDSILIDEGQDWPDDEKEILYAIFNPAKFVVADGMTQFVRKTATRTNWTSGIEFHKPIIAEKTSLRQKSNLCKFGQIYASEIGIGWDLKPRDDLSGGKVIILAKDYDKITHKHLVTECRESGNKPYEMLFLTPPSLVPNKQQRGFALANDWKSWGINLWDGTSSDVRSVYPSDVEQHRILQYESSRGLEGWAVVCLWLDDFIHNKMFMFDPTEEIQPTLGLFGADEAKREYAYNWSLIAITRAIDTLVITLKNPKSEYGQHLKAVYNKCKDFVEWIE